MACLLIDARTLHHLPNRVIIIWRLVVWVTLSHITRRLPPHIRANIASNMSMPLSNVTRWWPLWLHAYTEAHVNQDEHQPLEIEIENDNFKLNVVESNKLNKFSNHDLLQELQNLDHIWMVSGPIVQYWGDGCVFPHIWWFLRADLGRKLLKRFFPH